MIIYSNTKGGFVYDVRNGIIVKKIEEESNKVNGLNQKYTIIVEGGPGTGKSVVAIKLLCDLIQKVYSANYVTLAKC